MAKESALTLEEKQSISIEKLIFHIIVQEEDNPKYLEEVGLSEEHLKFFKERLINVSEGTQYIFSDKTLSETYSLSKDIIDDHDKNFLEVSKKLTAKFKQMHSRNTSDGVFITSLVSILNKRKLIFLIKLDHKKVYEYKLLGNKALLEEIKNTFIEDKSAVQKVALVDISDYYIWDVLAYDRAKPGGIIDYFRNFLTVTERETPTKLTENAIRLTNSWATLNKINLDPDQEISKYKNRAIAYLSDSDIFNSEEFVNYVVLDSDKGRKKELVASFNLFLNDSGLGGQSFKPSKSVINKKTKNNIRQTAEGVRIEWVGDANEKNINILLEPNSEWSYKIEILTNKIIDIQ